MDDSQEFHYQARDGVAIFMIVIWVFFPGGCMLGFPFMSKEIFTYSVLAFLVVILGLDCKISVVPGQVRFVRRLFKIPYYIRRGTAITDVCFDSDWDEEATASGVVAEIDGKETHIWAGKRKGILYSGLSRVKGQCRPAKRLEPTLEERLADGQDTAG